MPAPPIPSDADLRRFPYTPIVRGKLFNSWFHTHATPQEWRAGFTLWLKSWDQVPAGSLPDDDVELAFLADFGRDIKSWLKVKRVALHQWMRCDDGRLYHPTVTEGILEALTRRKSYQERGSKGGLAKAENASSANSSARAQLKQRIPFSSTGKDSVEGSMDERGKVIPLRDDDDWEETA